MKVACYYSDDANSSFQVNLDLIGASWWSWCHYSVIIVLAKKVLHHTLTIFVTSTYLIRRKWVNSSRCTIGLTKVEIRTLTYFLHKCFNTSWTHYLDLQYFRLRHIKKTGMWCFARLNFTIRFSEVCLMTLLKLFRCAMACDVWYTISLSLQTF